MSDDTPVTLLRECRRHTPFDDDPRSSLLMKRVDAYLARARRQVRGGVWTITTP